MRIKCNANWREAFANLYAALPKKGEHKPLDVVVNSNATRLLHGQAGSGLLTRKNRNYEKKKAELEEEFIVNASVAFGKEASQTYKKAIFLLNSIRSMGLGQSQGSEVAIPRLEAKLSQWCFDTHRFLKKIHTDCPPVLQEFLLKGMVARQTTPTFKYPKQNFSQAFRVLLVLIKKVFSELILKLYFKKHTPIFSVDKEIKKREKLDNLFNEDRARTFFPFSCQKLFTIMQALHYYFEIKRRINQSIPFEALFRLFENKNLELSQEQSIRTFLKACEQAKPPLAPRQLHELMRLIWRTVPSQNTQLTLSEVELKLMEYDCPIFFRNEAKHMQWRAELKRGDKLYIETQDEKIEMEVGEELGYQEKEDDKDRFRVFRLTNHPEKLLLVGNNRQIIGIEEQLHRNQGHYFTRPALKYLDPEGKFGVIEAMSKRVCDHQWTFRYGHPVQEDASKLNEIVCFIRSMLINTITPQKLDKKYLFFTKTNTLRYVKLSLAGDFDFCALERFCQIGPPEVRAYLIRESGLHNHDYALYFRSILERSIKNPDLDFRVEAAIKGITDDRIICQAERLINESQAIVQKVFKAVRAQYSRADAEKGRILAEISRLMLSTCQSHYTMSYLPEGLKERVMHEVLARFRG